MIKDNLSEIKGTFKIITTDNKGKVIRETPIYKNMVMNGVDTGFNLILDRLFGTNTYSLNITHLDIGDDDTAPALSDTLLGNAIARAGIATKSLVGNTITYRFFFADVDLPDGDYKEVGLFIDGTSSVDTGQIFTHSKFGSTYSKSAGENTTLEYQLTK